MTPPTSEPFKKSLLEKPPPIGNLLSPPSFMLSRSTYTLSIQKIQCPSDAVFSRFIPPLFLSLAPQSSFSYRHRPRDAILIFSILRLGPSNAGRKIEFMPPLLKEAMKKFN
jgi:hypothetical protein